MNDSSPQINVILADDHQLIREGFRFMLSKEKSINLIAEALDGQELIELTRQLHPDIVITDIHMPRINGIEAASILSKEFPEIGIIALSILDDEYLIVDMLEAGATGYLIKIQLIMK